MPKKSTTTKAGRGRPAHQPTMATRRKVSIAAGGGMRHEDIAMALGINTDTLRKYYEAEMSVGASQRRMEVLQSQYQAAMKKGSTSAARVYLAAEPQFVVPPAPLDGPPAPAAAPPPSPAPSSIGQPQGKKEKAAAEAVTAQAGTEWEGLLPKAGTVLQ